MNHSRTKTLLIIASAVALVGLALSGMLLYLISQKEAELAQIEQELAIAQAAEDSGVSMNHLLSDTKPERDKIDSYFIGGDNVVSFIEKVESLSALARVDTSINSVGIEKANAGNTFEFVTLNGTSEGTFSNVYWFLSLLESIPLEITVTQVYLDAMPMDPKTKLRDWRLTFTLKALKLK